MFWILLTIFFVFYNPMIDFTLRKYRELLVLLQKKGYKFITFEQYCEQKHTSNTSKWIILRHDVDLRAQNSLAVAQIENELGICASYYFRIVPESNCPEVIRAIADLGHEIGYHYEDMAIVHGDAEKAYTHFQEQLAYFRTYYPVRTICMHGAPTSKWDGKDLWKKYDYRAMGVIGEPYFDVDFSQVFYLTDTGRCWDGYKVSVRDKIPQYQDEWIKKELVYHKTGDIIRAAENDTLPPCIMITTHPQRWTDERVEWVKEMFTQTIKNVIKRLIIKIKGH
ncbi:MAG: hypothetical protein U0L47_04165 [Paludibacteraceae bacterium]|jgi:hypothetical protein|nr:hypothetical protein [Paludibacteraceae bacterium]